MCRWSPRAGRAGGVVPIILGDHPWRGSKRSAPSCRRRRTDRVYVTTCDPAISFSRRQGPLAGVSHRHRQSGPSHREEQQGGARDPLILLSF